MNRFFHSRLLVMMAMLPPSLFLLLLTSCSNDEPVSSEKGEICFRTALLNIESRATSKPLDPTDYSVWACSVFEHSGYSPIFYFGSQFLKLSYVAEKNMFASGYYFPLSGKMNFMAYAANNGASPTPTVTPSAPTAGSSVKTMVFNLKGSYKGEYEVAYSDAISVDCAGYKTDAPLLTFYHPQANLCFHFEGMDAAACEHIEINYIKVENVKCKGLLNVNLTTDPITCNWSGTVAADYLMVTNLTSHTISPTNGLDAGCGLYIIPQASRSRIIINYTMRNVGNTQRRTMNYVVNDETGQDWKAGYRYNYYILVRSDYQMEFRDVEVQFVSDGHTGNMHI